MGSVFFGVLRSGSAAEAQSFLRGLQPDDSAVVIPGAVVPSADAQPVAQGWSGDRQLGDVVIRFESGRPTLAWKVGAEFDAVAVPPAFWYVLIGTMPEYLQIPFLFIAYLESRYVADAHNPVFPDDSWGAIQVNRLAWPQWSPEYLSTYAGNLTAAQIIYNAQGFGAWFNSSTELGLV